MSDVYELVQGQVATDNAGVSTATRVFRVFTGDPTNRPEFGLVGGPNRYDPYPSDSRLLCVSVSSVALQGQPGFFDVSYQYTSAPFEVGTTDTEADPGASDPAQQPDPTSRTPTLRFSTSMKAVPLELDYDDPRKPVQNSAKQPFERQTHDVPTLVMTIGFNRSPSTNVVAKVLNYVGTVNDASYTLPWSPGGSFASGTLRCNAWNATLQYEAGYGWFMACEVELEYRRPNWALRIHDRGYFFKGVGNDGYGQEFVKPFRDMTTGQNLSAPRYLNGAGQPLPAGSPPVELIFYPYEYVSWTSLLT